MFIYILLVFLIYSAVLSFALSRKGFRHDGHSGKDGSVSKPDSILIIGGTGGTGRKLIEQALERGYKVTAFVRRPEMVTVEHPNLTVAKGDVMDPASVEAAMPGHDAVVSALGHKQFFYPTRILSEGTANILSAMKKSGIKRFVCMTSLGIGDSAWRMGIYYTFFTIPAILPFYFWDKTRQEQIVAASETDWTIVRPGSLTNGAFRGKTARGSKVGNYFWTVRVSRADVAAFMLDQLESDRYLHTAPGVAS